ncbi:hypothetical protein BDV96DRAFT_684910 [Lophiotrema nucula]|uniref:Uncharacterized protein n=1 Tax=Lophiotrema nucula TaxID=690887 RepID=A0A6A5ZGL9_9PLEO|nr:hypothetical protein BDV96DRAFT_684910 [Lophiotrema nucula]
MAASPSSSVQSSKTGRGRFGDAVCLSARREKADGSALIRSNRKHPRFVLPRRYLREPPHGVVEDGQAWAGSEQVCPAFHMSKRGPLHIEGLATLLTGILHIAAVAILQQLPTKQFKAAMGAMGSCNVLAAHGYDGSSAADMLCLTPRVSR